MNMFLYIMTSAFGIVSLFLGSYTQMLPPQKWNLFLFFKIIFLSFILDSQNHVLNFYISYQHLINPRNCNNSPTSHKIHKANHPRVCSSLYPATQNFLWTHPGCTITMILMNKYITESIDDSFLITFLIYHSEDFTVLFWALKALQTVLVSPSNWVFANCLIFTTSVHRNHKFRCIIINKQFKTENWNHFL